jgi:ribonuclease T1
VFRTGWVLSGGQEFTPPVLAKARALGRWSAAAALSAGLVFGAASAVSAKGADNPALGSVALSSLPVEAQATHRLVLSGGPFPYRKDGVVFGNRERLLPSNPRGYYREYTVKTPGSRDRGARRIVCGGQPPTQPAACFYTDDHYSSFRRITP